EYFGSYTQAAKIVLGVSCLILLLLLIRKYISSHSSKSYKLFKFPHILSSGSAASSYNICSCFHQFFHVKGKIRCINRIYRAALGVDYRHSCVWFYDQRNIYGLSQVLCHCQKLIRPCGTVDSHSICTHICQRSGCIIYISPKKQTAV